MGRRTGRQERAGNARSSSVGADARDRHGSCGSAGKALRAGAARCHWGHGRDAHRPGRPASSGLSRECSPRGAVRAAPYRCASTGGSCPTTVRRLGGRPAARAAVRNARTAPLPYRSECAATAVASRLDKERRVRDGSASGKSRRIGRQRAVERGVVAFEQLGCFPHRGSLSDQSLAQGNLFGCQFGRTSEAYTPRLCRYPPTASALVNQLALKLGNAGEHGCQSASKKDPLSASKRDPLRRAALR